jgi:hypothetical protein
MQIAKNCLHYPSLIQTWIFLNNIINRNFIFICMVKEKTMELWFQFLDMYNEF